MRSHLVCVCVCVCLSVCLSDAQFLWHGKFIFLKMKVPTASVQHGTDFFKNGFYIHAKGLHFSAVHSSGNIDILIS